MASSTVTVADPQGTWAAQTTVLTSGFARSAKVATPAGFVGGTAICSTFVAKSTGCIGVDQAAVGELGHVLLVGRGEDVDRARPR